MTKPTNDPLRIERIKAENFQGLELVDLEFGPITVFYGKNGAGKSSVREAIDYATTGHAPRKAILADTIRQGAASSHVEATLTNGRERLVVARKRTKSAGDSFVNGKKVAAGVAEAEVAKTFRVSTSSLAACLRISNLFDMKPADLQALLTAVTGATFTPAAILEALGPEIGAKAKKRGIGLPASIELFTDAFKRAEGARQAYKRQAQTIQEALSQTPEPTGEAGEHARTTLEAEGGNVEQAKGRIKKGIEALRKKRDEALKANAAATAAAAAQRSERIAGLRTRIDEAVEAAKAAAKKSQADLEARIAELRASPAVTIEGDPAGELAKLSAEASEVAQKVGALDTEIGRWTARVRDLEAAVAGGTEDGDAALIASLSTIAEDLERLKAEVPKLEAERAELLKTYKSQAEKLDKVPEKAGPCSVYPDTTCPLEPAHFATLGGKLAKALEDTRGKGTTIGTKLEAAKKSQAELVARQQAIVAAQTRASVRLELAGVREKLTAAQVSQADLNLRGTQIDKRADAVRQLAGQATAAADARAALTKAEGELATLKAAPTPTADTAAPALLTELRTLEAEAAKPRVDAPAIDVTETERRLELADKVLEALDVIARRAAKDRELAEATEAIEDADTVTKALGPDGKKKDLLGNAAGPFLNAANEALATFSPGYSVELEIEGDLAFRIRKVTPAGESRLTSEQLSDGERQRVLYPLQYAIAKLGGAGVIALDRVELIDPGARKDLVRTVTRWAKEGLQVVMLNSIDAPPHEPAGFTCYAMEGGRATRLPPKPARTETPAA
jgi:DNA repair exonuclease SbcCD ATPase subunit